MSAEATTPCGACRQPIPPAARFCRHCGARQADTPRGATLPTPSPAAAAAAPAAARQAAAPSGTAPSAPTPRLTPPPAPSPSAVKPTPAAAPAPQTAAAAPRARGLGAISPARRRTPRLAAAITGIGLVSAAAAAVGLWALRDRDAPPAPSTAAASAPATPKTGAGAPASPAPPLWNIKGKVEVVDTATLKVDGRTVRLAGIAGLGAPHAAEMQAFLKDQGDEVVCKAAAGGLYTCETTTGFDVAGAALVNGAARSTPDASEAYHALEAGARQARRGLWQ